MPTKIQSAIALCAALSALLIASTAGAAPAAGKIDYVSGTVSIQRVDGSKRLVGSGSSVEDGDTVQTAQNAEAVLMLNDNQRIYLKPETVFRIDSYNFAPNNPSESKSFTSLVRGGLRTISGLIGKQGNTENYQLKTKTATIGIRGTEYSVTECAAGSCGSLPDGLHVSVFDGRVLIANQGGGTEIAAGFGAIVRDVTTPLIRLPASSVQQVQPSPEACK